MLKCYFYSRCSGIGQVNGDTFLRQSEVVKRYSELNGIEIIKEFREEAVSGTKDSFDREALTDMMMALDSGEVKLVLVERADRLGRDLMVSELLLNNFRKIGVKVISASCGTDLTVIDCEPTKVLIRQILSAVSQWDKACLVAKLRVARMRIRKTKGKCEGRKPFGVSDTEKATIARIHSLNASGLNLGAISGLLNQEGVPTKARAKWYPNTVKRLLDRNLAYLQSDTKTFSNQGCI